MAKSNHCPIMRQSCLKPIHCYYLDETKGGCNRAEKQKRLTILTNQIQIFNERNADGRLRG